jgi:hypothetical protein
VCSSDLPRHPYNNPFHPYQYQGFETYNTPGSRDQDLSPNYRLYDDDEADGRDTHHRLIKKRSASHKGTDNLVTVYDDDDDEDYDQETLLINNTHQHGGHFEVINENDEEELPTIFQQHDQQEEIEDDEEEIRINNDQHEQGDEYDEDQIELIGLTLNDETDEGNDEENNEEDDDDDEEEAATSITSCLQRYMPQLFNQILESHPKQVMHFET